MSKNKSPLRYPGGKTRAIAILEKYVTDYYPTRKLLLSPFIGGGSFELYLQNKGYHVKANDLFKPLYTFWQILQANPAGIRDGVKAKMPITKEIFSEMRKNILTIEDPLQVAIAYYIINRCSFSGSTFCGGFSKESSTGRLNESCIGTMFATRLTNVTFSNMDCCAFLDANPETENTVIYADPPYYITTYIYGKDGDMHAAFDHAGFAENIKKRKDWIISYNDCEYIRNLYAGCRFFTEKWSYGMNATKKSSEVIILPSVSTAPTE